MKTIILVLSLNLCYSQLGKCQIGDDQPGQNQPSTEEQLAGQFYANGEWEKAADMYENLYSETQASFYYQQLLSCYLKLRNIKAAEKLTARQSRKNPKQLGYFVDLGYVYQQAGDSEKGKKQFEKAIKQINPTEEIQIKELAATFEKYGLIEFAIRTYAEAKNNGKSSNGYHMELAGLYAKQGETDKMLTQYFEALNKSTNLSEQVQERFQDIIAEDAGGEKFNLIREKLIREIQKNPDNFIFPEMLIWILIQKKDFESAFIQSKSLDKRYKENGRRVLDLARIAVSNEQFDIAKRAYQYVISQSRGDTYVHAKKELALALYRRLTTAVSYSPQDLSELNHILKETFTEIGAGEQSYAVAIRLGHLLAFYRDKADSAIAILSPLTDVSSGLSLRSMNEVKLEIADIQLLQGEIWEATLTYSQVEKSMKTDTLGQEAKFRNARLAYYKGEFEWARAQLDVLKAATSKLTANDALELSLLISDNTVYDSTGEALRMFSRADLWFYQNKADLAMMTLDSLERGLPGTSLGDDILLRKAKVSVARAKYPEAITYLEKLLLSFHDDILADNALFLMAELYEKQLKDSKKAMDLYKELMTDFPGSLLVVEARKRYRTLRGDTMQ